ncbi:TPA: pilus assembly protein PilX [Citrobacter freundii]|uniref:type 4 pilus major pilin n=1 Tax=Leclercia adecarboxylata TaxID=83655 RepID=UPI00124D040D|nr:type 4 pilus major pilin [Leclercia adecarboxylata]QFH52900.1 pilus assembly protein PilX [Leclercia adecarboxylata]HED2436074.1 pilus assembly protein PilX [Citrobacter freundii]
MQYKPESVSQPSRASAVMTHHRGWAFLEQGSIALIVLVLIGIVLGAYFGLKSNVNVGKESSNIQSIITSTQNLLKGSDGYTFTSGAKMMGSLIQMKALPKTMTVRGTASSGNATLYNGWGGAVTLSPVTVSGFANGFSLTYELVPQDACVQLSTQLSRVGIADAITINSTAHTNGIVTTEEASAQCSADNGSTGTNKIIFTVNS